MAWRTLALPVAAIALLGTTTSAAVATTVHGSATPDAAPPITSYANVSSDLGFDLVEGDLGGKLQAPYNVHLTGAGTIAGSAIAPNGDSALYTTENATPFAVSGFIKDGGSLTETEIDLSAFGAEGDVSYTPLTYGVAVTSKFGLMAIAEQGVVACRFSHGAWGVDTRVQSSGVNENGNAHQPGFIRFGPIPVNGTAYHGVAISQVPLKDGSYLGLAIDRGDDTITVIKGIGTATPLPVGVITDPSLATPLLGDAGDGGMAFSPATATRAVVTTKTGVSVLDLSDPVHPVLLPSRTLSPLPGAVQDVAVAPDGDHVAVTGSIYVDLLSGLRHTTKKLHVVDKDPFLGPQTDLTYAVGYAADGTVIVHDRFYDPTAMANTYQLTSFSGGLTGPLKYHKAVTLTGAPDIGNTLSVFPSVIPQRIGPKPLSHAKVKKPYQATLRVSGGIGAYKFKILSGTLPKGLALHHGKITGTATHKGKKTVAVRAVNQYGGAVFGNVTIKVT